MPTPIHILHIEDEPFDTEMLYSMLTRDGLVCEISRVETREELMAALEQQDPDIILSDFSLPQFDGYAALAVRQEVCPEIPFIIISGTLGEEAAIEAFARGATDYILKARLERLSPSVQRALREAQERAERRKAEAELRLAHQRLRFHLENTPLLVVEWNSDFRITYWSPQAEAVFGWTADEVLGKDPDEIGIVYIEDREAVAALMMQLLEGDVVQISAQNRNYRKDGSVIWCDWHNSVLKDEQGNLISILSLGLDITSRKRIEEERALLLAREQAAREQAEAANRAKDEFLAAVSHELRTPLTPVLGWLRMLRGEKLDAQHVSKAMEKIEQNVRAEIRLVEDLLDASRIITGKLQLDLRPLDLSSVVSASVESMRPAAEARNITLMQKFDPLVGMISGDADRLRQVIWNLLSNAIKFTPPQGTVSLSVENVQSHIEITVSDTGQGIDPEFLPHVFDRFRQADGSPSRKYGGLGLGLAIVRHLVELHGGTVQASSQGPGMGSAFMVRLPPLVYRRSVHESRRSLNADAGKIFKANLTLSGLRVLAVDDDPDTLELVSFVLEQADAQVLTATTAEAAVSLFEKEKVDVLVSDIAMPGTDGYQLIIRIREIAQARGQRIPAIALTAFTRTEDRLRALSAGFQMHLPKPIEPAELLAVVASLTSDVVRN
jgi:PAS domain S-box-containing protein